MSKYASKVVEQAKAWLGLKDSDGSHKEIIDVYNSHKPLARGHKMSMTDEWCAATVSAVSIKLGYTDIIPLECSCTKMIELFKKLDSWEERDSVTPEPAWILFYDWEDKKDYSGDNKNRPNHVGIAEKVSGGKITVIEGNYKNGVNRRTLSVNGKYIRGYGVPKYDEEPAENPVLEWQKAAIADGYKFPKYGADGEWGAECVSVARKALVMKKRTYTNKNLTKIVQNAVGVTVDGLCGTNTDKAIVKYQKEHGLVADGVVGLNTWKKILGV
jgi:peptidoglycan hydrolase-like protein with peptidoglycan-binding domain